MFTIRRLDPNTKHGTINTCWCWLDGSVSSLSCMKLLWHRLWVACFLLNWFEFEITGRWKFKIRYQTSAVKSRRRIFQSYWHLSDSYKLAILYNLYSYKESRTSVHPTEVLLLSWLWCKPKQHSWGSLKRSIQEGKLKKKECFLLPFCKDDLILVSFVDSFLFFHYWSSNNSMSHLVFIVLIFE